MNASSLACSSAAAAPWRMPSRPISARRIVVYAGNYADVTSFSRSLLRRGQRGRHSMTLRAASASSAIVPPPGGAPVPPVLPESEVPGLSQFLDTLKFDSNGMLVAIVQVKKGSIDCRSFIVVGHLSLVLLAAFAQPLLSRAR